MNSVSPICCFRSNRILSVQLKHTTRCHRSHNRKNSLPLILCFFWSSSTQWILSSTSITFLSLLCAVSQGPNPFDRFQKTLLGNWCQRGRESSHQSLITPIGGDSNRGSETFFSKERPHLFGIQRGEKLHVFRGERHAYVVLCLLCSIFLFPIFSQYPL